MRSECTAASPQFIYSYAWKVPPARPAIFERAQKLVTRAGEECERNASQAEHPSIPWKAYLASREFQHMASDLAEALFTETLPAGLQAISRPASLMPGAQPMPGAAGKHPRGLLAAALPDAAGTASHDLTPSELRCNLPIAA
ncbi:MAG: hypothetical protein ACLPWS_06145 [Rhodomicrobium sp.]